MRENPKEAAGRAKPQLQLLPPKVLEEVAAVLEHGAEKYGAWNWRYAGIQKMTYVGAALRHVHAIADGEDIDPDSGKSHWAHVIACALVARDAENVDMCSDDRPHVHEFAPEPGENDGLIGQFVRAKKREVGVSADPQPLPDIYEMLRRRAKAPEAEDGRCPECGFPGFPCKCCAGGRA